MKITPEEQVAKEASGGVSDDAKSMKLMVRKPAGGVGSWGGGGEGKKGRREEGKKGRRKKGEK